MIFRLDGPAVRYSGEVCTILLERIDFPGPEDGQAFLRTNLFLGSDIDEDILDAMESGRPESSDLWSDFPMELIDESRDGQSVRRIWKFEALVSSPGYFWAKPYFSPSRNPHAQDWPDGDNLRIHVHRQAWKNGNSLYCAWPRLMDDRKNLDARLNENQEKSWSQLEQNDLWVQPRSGTFRQLRQSLDHIMGDLGFRILHLMPVNPVPYTDTRLGRMGSPYAATSLVDIDPAQVEFDRKSTGLEQFEELVSDVHRRDGRVIIDLVINHTGWGSRLFEDHPEFFERHPDGTFVSPGAWGTVWEDLVALNHKSLEQISLLTEAFMTWCHRGVDGFRCDAGYQVPLPIWRYITAAVRREFPDALFFLEGLGGAVEATQALLREGGMQWAYSELFQNESHGQVASYPDFSQSMSLSTGCFVHYSETHDNNRLASRGPGWAAFRNKLCAALSANGAFGITTGVEWLADEKIRVHNKSGLRWGHSDNIVSLLSRINRVLRNHPSFAAGSEMVRMTPPGQAVILWRRWHPSDPDRTESWILVNNDPDRGHDFHISHFSYRRYSQMEDLFGGTRPDTTATRAGGFFDVHVPALSVHVLGQPLESDVVHSSDSHQREDGRLLEHLVACLHEFAPGIPRKPVEPGKLLTHFRAAPNQFLNTIQEMSPDEWAGDWFSVLTRCDSEEKYCKVSHWFDSDVSREMIVPDDHWLVVHHHEPFRLWFGPGSGSQQTNGNGNPTQGYSSPGCWRESVPSRTAWGHIVCLTPSHLRLFGGQNLSVQLIPHGSAIRHALAGKIHLSSHLWQKPEPLTGPVFETSAPESPCVLLTNGRGAMSMIRIDPGVVESKYDCILGANLNESLPVDRHVFVKRIRLWGRVGRRTVPLNRERLINFQWQGSKAVWHFQIADPSGPLVDIGFEAWMEPFANTVRMNYFIVRDYRSQTAIENQPASLVVRVDLEDRNFHTQTHLDSHTASFFAGAIRVLDSGDGLSGFRFAPTSDRHLHVVGLGARFHPHPENCTGIGHPVEASRGQEGAGDAYSPGWFEISLDNDNTESAQLVFSSESLDLTKLVRDDSPNMETGSESEAGDLQNILTRALRDFVVRRDKGWTVIAGYPWFLDWGRDTLIVARGMVSAGMHDEVLGILRNFGRYEEKGTLPNTIHGGDLSNRHTSDAPLWFGVVCEDMEAEGFQDIFDHLTADDSRSFRDVLTSIANGYRSGTPAGMKMDPESGLIWSPSHFTWMDTNFPAGTPREGYPIEIQVLWYRHLRLMARIDSQKDRRSEWGALADQVRQSIDTHFWRDDLGYYADLLVCAKPVPAAQAEQDSALRSNQIIAVALGLATGDKARRSVSMTIRYLVVPGGLRSLAPLPVERPHAVHSNQGFLLNDPLHPYWPKYEGDEDTRRKPAYHNGTAWSWTFPGFCEALVKAYEGDADAMKAARCYLLSIGKTLRQGCYMQIPEVMDGSAPHTQRGCPAQAWGVSEALRVWNLLNKAR